MVARSFLPPTPSNPLNSQDRTIPDARPRSVSRHVGRTRRRNHDRGATRTGGLAEADRIVGGIRRHAAKSPAAASISVMPVVASSTFPSVRAWATITPDRSTPRCSFFQPRLPRPPCFAAAHSPSPTIESPVLSTMRCVPAPAWARQAWGRDADHAVRAPCDRAQRGRGPTSRRSTSSNLQSGAVAGGRGAGASARFRSRGPSTAAARHACRRPPPATR